MNNEIEKELEKSFLEKKSKAEIIKFWDKRYKKLDLIYAVFSLILVIAFVAVSVNYLNLEFNSVETSYVKPLSDGVCGSNSLNTAFYDTYVKVLCDNGRTIILKEGAYDE